MPKIIWKNAESIDAAFPCAPLPPDAKKIIIPKNNMAVSLVFALPWAALLFLALWGRVSVSTGRPLSPWFIPLGVLAGVLLIPLHEWLHAAVYPKNAEAYIGLIPKQFMAYAHCAAPLLKKRFILMCLLPMVLGVVPFLLFLVCPLGWPAAAAVLWPCAMIGLVSPSPDYLNVFLVCRAAPKGAFIQCGEDGLYWYLPSGGRGGKP